MGLGKYFWQHNKEFIEVIYEDDSGFTWICDCGRGDEGEETAKLLVKLLNNHLGVR